MMANDRLEQLLDLWMTDRDCGIIRTASEICTENPELVEELSRRIEIVRRFEHLADVDHSETLVSQGNVDTSHLTNAPVPTALKPTIMPGSIGPFRPLELLGEGGMGAVYLAEDPQLGRRVAVKVMKKELAADSDARHRFLREARAMATVEHDNIMTIYAVGEDQGMPYLVMPVLKGETLDDRLRRESRLSADETRRIGEEIAAGLAAAHSHGLIHRDIKPSNIWLEGTQGRVRILDFGLARPANDDQKVTHSGAVLGTPSYMAPEQAAGAAATTRSDLFSLGAVLYRMTTGVQPFAGPNIMATLSNLANKQPEPPRKICPEVPESLSELILRLIAKPPEDRPESAAIVVESLQPTLETVVPHFTFSPSPVRSRKKPAGRPSVDQPLNKVASSTRPPRTFRKGLAAGFAGFLVLMSIIVYRIQTDKGVLIVSIDDEQVAAKLTKGGLEIEDAKTGRTWTIKPDQPESVSSGEYKISPPDGLLLYVTDDTGTEFTTAEFKIKRGDQIKVRVAMVREETSRSVVASGWQGWAADAPLPAIAPFSSEQAQKHQEAWSRYLNVPVEYTNSIGMKFRLIPPGEFTMGSKKEEIEEALKLETAHSGEQRWLDCISSESPQHTVILPQPVYIGVNEVTQAEYEKVMGVNPSHFAPNGPGKDSVTGIETSAHPVDSVTWNDASEFFAKLSKQEELKPFSFPLGEAEAALDGTGYRLPREAEWEYACRAGTTTNYWLGKQDEDLVGAGWFADNSGGRTHAVGELKANPYGLYDIHGNVFEWVEDWWEPTYYRLYQERPAVNPSGPSVGSSQRVIRGGGWAYGAYQCRASDRRAHLPDYGQNSFGFRASLTVHAVRASLKLTGPTIPKSQSMELSSAKPAPETSISKSAVPASEWNGWPKDAPAPAITPFDAAQAKRHQEEWAKHLGVPVEYTNSIGMKFVLIPPGEFLMGSTSAEIEDLLTQIADAESVRDRLQMESPQHRVVLTKAFYLGVHEVTQAQFAGVMGNNPSFLSSTGGGKDLVLQIDTSAYPVEQVSWNDTTEFCRRLSLQENVVPATSEPNRDSTPPNGSGYWLPTEAEWEFACRAGTTTWFWNGNEIENLKTIDLFGPTTGQVGQLKANPFGVHDLHGNVCEFVHDCWDPDSYKKHSGEPAIDPIGGVPEAHALTLYRGSHWSGCDESARSAARKVGYERSTSVASHLGFRVKLPWTTVKEFLRSENSRLHSAAGHTRHVPVGPSPFDAMSYSQIPEKERLDCLPKDVVAVLGTHEQKTWAAPGRYLRQTIGTLDYSPDGKWICACDWSNAYLFDATNLLLKSTIQNVSANPGSRRPLVFSPDSKSLFVGGIASNSFWGTAVVDLTTTEPSVKLLPMSDACLSGNAIAVAEQGDFVSYVDSAGTAIGTATRDPITGTMGKRAILPDHEEISDILKSRGIGELAFSPDAEWLVTGYVGGGYQIFRRHSTDNGEFRPVDFIQTQPLGNGEMRAAFSFTASHKRALLVEVANCRLLDLSLLDNLAEDMPVPPHLSLELDPPKELTNIKDISISRDGQTWVASQAVSDSCSQLLIGNWVDGRPEVQKSIDLPNYFAGRVALSPDASSVAVLANGHVLQVIDLTRNPPIKRPSLDETRMASNSDLSRTITVGTDGVIRLDATTPEKHEVLDSRQLDLGWADVRMSDDGKRAVSISVGDLNISKRSRIYVWNLEQDKLDKFAEFELSEGRENAWPVLFSHGTRLLYGNQIWDISLPSPTVISDFVQLPPNPAASAVTEDGRLVAFATPDGQLSLYATLGPVDRPLTTKKLPSSPASLSFSLDGRRLVALFAGGIGTVWDLADGQLAEARQLPGQWQIPPGGPPYHMTSAVFSRDDHRVYFSGWGGVGEWNLDENKVTRFWPLPGFATFTMANDDRHLILNNSNCTTWVLRLTEP